VTRRRRLRIADHRGRLIAAQANAVEIRVAKESGELAPVRDMELRWSRLIVAARTRLLGLPSRLGQLRPNLTREDLAAVDRLVREALEELADER
jgi:phage terminase Nu1 subunit (DNA packaging protein)